MERPRPPCRHAACSPRPCGRGASRKQIAVYPPCRASIMGIGALFLPVPRSHRRRRGGNASPAAFFRAVNTKSFFWGEGNTLISAVDARSFLRRNGHGLRPPSVAASAQGAQPFRRKGVPVIFPPSPPILPPTRFFRGGTAPVASPFQRLCVACIFYLSEINRNVSINRP